MDSVCHLHGTAVGRVGTYLQYVPPLTDTKLILKVNIRPGRARLVNDAHPRFQGERH